jgi:hypothetical protein
MDHDDQMRLVAKHLTPFKAASGNICSFKVAYVGENINVECDWKRTPIANKDIEDCNDYVTRILSAFIQIGEMHDQTIMSPKEKDRTIAEFLLTGIVPEGARIIKPKEEPSGNVD